MASASPTIVCAILFISAATHCTEALHDAPVPPTQCDGVNCFVILPSSSSHRAINWSPEQLAAAAPADLLELHVSAHSNLSLTSTDCKDPVPLNARTCTDQPCGSMGKGYFTSPYTGLASCSGSFITDNIVLTAGHCCMEKPGAWSFDMSFFLDYDHGQYSAHYLPTELIVPEPWNNSSDRRYDWCFMKMNGSAPKHLTAAWAYDPGRFSNGFSSYGWPAIEPYDGSSLYKATGECLGTSPVWPPSQYDPCSQVPTDGGMMYMTCNTMTPGCSGGPWFDPSIGIFGLNSALIQAPGHSTVYVTPYFGNDFHGSCKQAAACT